MERALPAPSHRFEFLKAVTPGFGRIEEVNKELWLLLSMFGLGLLFNNLLGSQRMVLSFYAFPTLYSAYNYGRRHATLTAFASVLIVRDDRPCRAPSRLTRAWPSPRGSTGGSTSRCGVARSSSPAT